MLKKMCNSIGVVTTIIAIVAVAHHSVAQPTKSSTKAAAPSASPSSMTIHAYTKYADDLEHCFVQDNRSLYFDAYTDVAVLDPKTVDFYLYNLRDGVFTDRTPNDAEKVITVSGKLITIQIKQDARPHLGPGPYMAMISILPSSGAKRTASTPSWYYYYGTWNNSSSPLDCWH
jgi:hypothetical protein